MPSTMYEYLFPQLFEGSTSQKTAPTSATTAVNKAWSPITTGTDREKVPGILGRTLLGSLNNFAPSLLGPGFQNFAALLQSGGRTDPRTMNYNLTQIGRGTAAQQGDLAQELARRGLGNSGLGMAMGQAIGAGGQDRMAQARAQEAALVEERKRQDIQLLMSLLGLGQEGGALEMQRKIQKETDAVNKKAAQWSAVANLIGGIIPG